MRDSVLRLLKCPLCHAKGTFAVRTAHSDEREIREGQIAWRTGRRGAASPAILPRTCDFLGVTPCSLDHLRIRDTTIDSADMLRQELRTCPTLCI